MPKKAQKPPVDDYELPELSDELEALLDEADECAEGDLSERTRDAYSRHWRFFSTWCVAQGLSPTPASPQALRGYMVKRAKAGCSVATISLDLSAIVHAHKQHGLGDPTVHPAVVRTWGGLRKKLGVAQDRKEPATLDVLRQMLATLAPGTLAHRDKALLTLGFAGGFRRQELVSLDVEHLRFVRGGLEVRIQRSKSDQEGAGQIKEIAYGKDVATCPVRALKDWLTAAKIRTGAVFRNVNRHGGVSPKRLTGQSVNYILKRAIYKAGLPAHEYSAHSLRAGFVTTAKMAGIDDASIMKVTGHKSIHTMNTYDRRTKKWKDPATGRLGL